MTPLTQLFNTSKMEILDKVTQGVKSFQLDRRSCVQSDWCKHGIGYLLLQKHCSCPDIDSLLAVRAGGS